VQADDFKRKLREVLQRETLNSCTINIRRHANVYASGDQKLLMHSSEGKEAS
jgi:hypothetical protein